MSVGTRMGGEAKRPATARASSAWIHAFAGITLFWLGVLIVSAWTIDRRVGPPPPDLFIWIAGHQVLPYLLLHAAALLLACAAPESDTVLAPASLAFLATSVIIVLVVRWRILPLERFDRDVLVVLTMLGQGYGVKYHAMTRAKELRISRMQVRFAELEARILKTQVRPEFVPRVLRVIGELLDRDARAADRLLIRTGDFLRMALRHSRGSSVSLADEAAYLDAYSHLALVPSDGAFRIEWDLDADAGAAFVPNLILLPIVDVLLAKAASCSGDGAGVRVVGRAEPEGVLNLMLLGIGSSAFTATEIRATSGFQQLRSRLSMLFPRTHDLHVADGPQGGMLTIRLPLSTASQ